MDSVQFSDPAWVPFARARGTIYAHACSWGHAHVSGDKALDVRSSRPGMKQCARHIEVEAGARGGAGLGRRYDGLHGTNAMSDSFGRHR